MGCTGGKKPKEPNGSSATVLPEIHLGQTKPDPPLTDATNEQPIPVSAPKSVPMTTIVTTESTMRVLPEAPVSLLMQGKVDQLLPEEDTSFRLEAPALRPKRKTSMDLQAEEAQALREVLRIPSVDKEPEVPKELPQIKSIANTKSSFDPAKYRKANQGALPPLSNLPFSVQDQLDDIQILGGPTGHAGMKPSSSLHLAMGYDGPRFSGTRPLMASNSESKITNLEQYVSGRLPT